MDSDRQQCADQILEAIEYGHLSKEEMERRLNQILDDELSGPVDAEYDAVKVELCNSLLWQLQVHGRIELQLPSAKNKEVIENNHSSYKRKVTRIRRSVFTAASVLIILITLSALDVISPIQWFTRHSINDEQQYIVEGHSLNVDTISHAIAEHFTSNNTTLTTDDYQELVRFLGFDPDIPVTISTNACAVQYRALFTPQCVMLSSSYSDDLNTVYRISIYQDADQAYMQFEQDEEGKIITVSGVSVYTYTNVNKTNFLWIEGTSIHSVSMNTSPINYDVIQSIVREGK